MSWSAEEVKNHIAAGPWGGQSGSRWDDGVYHTVRQVVITTNSSGIDSIQFEYDKNGFSFWSDKHGGNSGIKTDKINLDYPNEYLISISGHYGPAAVGGPIIVRSLCFVSNRRKYGPFGVEQGTPFSLPITDGKLVGFHGQSSWHLYSIGVYVKPLKKNDHLERQNALHGQVTYGYGYDHGKVKGSEAVYGMNRMDQSKFTADKVVDQVVSDHKVISAPHTDIVLPSINAHPVTSAPHINAVLPTTKRVRRCGPWGGDGGMTFDDGMYTGVREVHITRSGALVSIRACYDLNGKAIWGDKNGGSAGIKLEKIVFDYPFEVLTHVSGYYGSMILWGPTVIKSITFHTTKRSYGPFGDQQGFAFTSASTTNGVVVGFYGKKGHFVNSIGVHVLEGQPMIPQPNSRDPFDMSIMKASEVVWGVPTTQRGPAIYEIGPWGGEGGKPWNDGVYTGVKKILVTRGETICSIQIEYDQNGQSIWSPEHGTSNNACTYSVKFDYPYEVLTSVSGYYDTLHGDKRNRVVRSLTFHTNKAKYGPYGKEMGTYFCLAKTESRVVGFHGRSGYFLDAIGVHMQYWLPDPRFERGAIKSVLHKIF